MHSWAGILGQDVIQPLRKDAPDAAARTSGPCAWRWTFVAAFAFAFSLGIQQTQYLSSGGR